jgi:hypothetical protein
LRTNTVKPRPVRNYRKRPETDRPEGDNADEGFVTVEKKTKRRVPKKQE